MQSVQELLAPYHGVSRLAGIPDHVQQEVLTLLGPDCLQLSVAETRRRLSDLVAAESLVLQFGAFQQALQDGIISL